MATVNINISAANGASITSLTANSYFDSDYGTYYINVNLVLTNSVLVDTVFEILLDGGMMSTLTVLAGNSIGSDNLDTGNPNFGDGSVSACVLSCSDTYVDFSSKSCPV